MFMLNWINVGKSAFQPSAIVWPPAADRRGRYLRGLGGHRPQGKKIKKRKKKKKKEKKRRKKERKKEGNYE